MAVVQRQIGVDSSEGQAPIFGWHSTLAGRDFNTKAAAEAAEASEMARLAKLLAPAPAGNAANSEASSSADRPPTSSDGGGGIAGTGSNTGLGALLAQLLAGDAAAAPNPAEPIGFGDRPAAPAPWPWWIWGGAGLLLFLWLRKGA